MNFEIGNMYHIFNQGNNRRQIFFRDENYLFFLRKMEHQIKPYGDFICYCLMPNHFHWLFQVRRMECPQKTFSSDSKNPDRNISLNESIGIALRSYSRAINKWKGWSGSLFKGETKAKTSFISEFITVDSKHWDKSDYFTNCFQYIHNNPLPSLANRPENYKYSSAREYAGMTESTICNLDLGSALWIASQHEDH